MLRCKVSRSADRDPDARQFAEAGVDAINRLASGDDPRDGVGTATDGGAAAGIDRQRVRRDRWRASPRA